MKALKSKLAADLLRDPRFNLRSAKSFGWLWRVVPKASANLRYVAIKNH